MSHWSFAVVLLVAACTKSAPKDNGGGTGTDAKGGGDKVMVPGGDVAPPNMAVGRGGREAAQATGAADSQKLAPDEGKLAIDPPADAKAGAEATAKITVTPGASYHVNTEFPSKLTLTAPEGVTLARTEWKMGGPSKDKGDADKRLELAFRRRGEENRVGHGRLEAKIYVNHIKRLRAFLL